MVEGVKIVMVIARCAFVIGMGLSYDHPSLGLGTLDRPVLVADGGW